MNNLVKMAQKAFPVHKELTVRLRKEAKNPFGSSVFDSFLRNRKKRQNYHMYIHLRDNYIRFSTAEKKDTFQEIRLPIDDKLWIEIKAMFVLIKVDNMENEEAQFHRRIEKFQY